MFQVPSYFIFVLNYITRSFLHFQSIFQILFGVYLVSIFVLKHQCEISDHPKKSREATDILANFTVFFGLDVFGEV